MNRPISQPRSGSVRAQMNHVPHQPYNNSVRPQMSQPSTPPSTDSGSPQTGVHAFSQVVQEFRQRCSVSNPRPPQEPFQRNSSSRATVTGYHRLPQRGVHPFSNVVQEFHQKFPASKPQPPPKPFPRNSSSKVTGPLEVPLLMSKLRPLPGYIEITTTEPDMLGLDDSPVCAKMPCGHVIGPDSMAAYIEDELRKGNCRFYCPAVDDSGKPCNSEWQRDHVRHVACYTAEENQEFERKIADNFLKRSQGMQTCPGCRTWCFCDPGTESRVLCPLCTKSHNGREFAFCWLCLKEWKSPRLAELCGNPGCHGNGNRLHILATCPTKQISCCTQCPSIRGCPRCGLLIEHKTACAHTICTNCRGYGFCFICLVGKEVGGEWQCSYAGSCRLAPRQTSLPGLG